MNFQSKMTVNLEILKFDHKTTSGRNKERDKKIKMETTLRLDKK